MRANRARALVLVAAAAALSWILSANPGTRAVNDPFKCQSDNRRAHRHRAPVQPGLVAREALGNRFHVGARRRCEPLRRRRRRLVSAAGGQDPVAGVFWGADGDALCPAGDVLMRAAADGSEAPRAAWSAMPGRNVVASRDGAEFPISSAAATAGGPGAGRGDRWPSRCARWGGAPPPSVPTEIQVPAASTTRRATKPSQPAKGPCRRSLPGRQTLTFTSGGAAETIRHEQTPEYSGAKIIYTITENVAGHARRHLGRRRSGRHAGEVTRRPGAESAAAAATAGSTRRIS